MTYWSCYHVDDIDECTPDIPSFNNLKNKTISSILIDSLNTSSPTDTDTSLTSAKSIIDLNLLLQKCAHLSCSMINDTNQIRTIDRIQTYLYLINNNEHFRSILIAYLIQLQSQKENSGYSAMSTTWFIKDVSSLTNIKQYQTLRNACKNYIETKLSPLIGFILANIDNYFNLNILYEELLAGRDKNNWKVYLWLNIF